MKDVTIDSKWGERYQSAGITLSTDSGMNGAFLQLPAGLDGVTTDPVRLTPEQVYALKDLFNRATQDLEHKGHWPKRPVTRGE